MKIAGAIVFFSSFGEAAGGGHTHNMVFCNAAYQISAPKYHTRKLTDKFMPKAEINITSYHMKYHTKNFFFIFYKKNQNFHKK